MNNKNYNNLSEEDFLKNRAKRKTSKSKPAAKKKADNKTEKKFHPALKWVLISLGIVLGIILIVVLFGLGYYFLVANVGTPDKPDETNYTFINSEGNEVNRAEQEKGGKKYYTFLATATDAGGTLTDVIMVANFHYDDKEPGVSIMQLPRDTYVKISVGKLYFNDDGTLSEKNFSGPTATYAIKLNEAFYHGRLLAEDKIDALLKQAKGKTEEEIKTLVKEKEYVFLSADTEKIKLYIEETDKNEQAQIRKDILRDFGLVYLQSLIYYDFGIPIDYHAQVNIKGFRGIVNAIDGVDLYIDQPMHYEDPYQDLYIHFNPGQHHLNGKKAEEFVRFRSYPGGDVDRLDAQKKFINAFLKKLLSFSTVTKIDSITNEVKENLYTDISFNNMLKFANKVLQMDLKEDVRIYTLPGIGEYIGAVSYFVADKDEVIELVNAEFNVFDSPLIKEDFRILDSSEIYRPAVVTDETDEESADGENDESTNADEESTDGDTDESIEDNDDNNGESDDENDENDNSENDGSESDIENAKDDNENIENEATDEEETEASASDNTGETAVADKEDAADEPEAESESSNDDNYQLLLDMQQAA